MTHAIPHDLEGRSAACFKFIEADRVPRFAAPSQTLPPAGPLGVGRSDSLRRERLMGRDGGPRGTARAAVPSAITIIIIIMLVY